MYQRKNSVSVVVGNVPGPGETVKEVIERFLKKHPLFNRKYAYDDFSWPCYEKKELLIAAFKFRVEGYRIVLHP